MELPNLLTLKKSSQNPDTPKYLALEIGLDCVKSAAWEVHGTKPQLVKLGSVESTDISNPDDLLEAIDESISQAIDGISPEPNEVVFSFPDHWIEDGQLTKDKKRILKIISQKLELKPLGFVVTIEAIIQHFNAKKGNPVTSIFLGISAEDVVVTIVQNGKIIGNQQVGRSDDLGSDVEEGIARYGSISNLPPNIILYNGTSDLEELKQTLISYNWQERLPFLHIPRIDSLSPSETILAVVQSGGAEVIKSLEIDSNQPPQPSSPSPQQSPPTMTEEFGFRVSHTPTSQENESAMSADQSDTKPSKEDDNLEFIGGDLTLPDEDMDIQENEPTLKTKTPFFRFSLPSIFTSRSSFSGSSRLPIVIIASIIFVILFATGVATAYWYLPKAIVTIYLQPKVIDKDFIFTIDPALTSADEAANTIPGRPQQTQVTASSTLPTTGKKLIGEQATGTITIYNRTDSVKTFAAGTKLTTSDKLVYTIDQEVKIASASSTENADLSVTTQPSTIDASITAIDIGAQYNISTNTEFSVANFDKSSFIAKAKTDIAGGSSRQVSAVSKEDIASLKQEVQSQLTDKASQQSSANQQDFLGAIILPNQQDDQTENFSAKVGDEADEVSLEASYQLETMTYKKSDLQLIIKNTLKDSIPEGYQLTDQDSDIESLKVAVNENQSITVQAKTKAYITTKLDPIDVSNNIKGKFPSITESYFKGLPGFVKVKIDIRPNLPAKIKTFPRLTKNIEVKFETNQNQ